MERATSQLRLRAGVPPKPPSGYKPTPRRLAAAPASRANQNSAQLKPAISLMLERRPAPPVYRPQARATQPKQSNSFRLENRPAPPVYRPNAAVQQKSQASQKAEKRPAPAVYRPGDAGGSPVAQSKAQLFPGSPAHATAKQPPAHPLSAHISVRPMINMNRSSVLQRMEGHPEEQKPEAFMRSQYAAEGMPVDLNCGRYCVESAIRWWGEGSGMNLKPDIFHELPEPTPKEVKFWGISWGSVKASWSPGVEGQAFTVAIDKPTSLLKWKNAIDALGPLTVSGDLGNAIVTYVGHYILVVGVDLATQELICKDPLKGNKTVRHAFSWIQGRIQTVHAVNLDTLPNFEQQ